MKRTFTFLLAANLLVLFSFSLLAYTEKRSGRTEEYCKVQITIRLSKQFIAKIDYGQESKIPPEKLETRLVKGISHPFYSEVDLLNYLNNQGWELVAAWDREDSRGHFFMMKRRL